MQSPKGMRREAIHSVQSHQGHTEEREMVSLGTTGPEAAPQITTSTTVPLGYCVISSKRQLQGLWLDAVCLQHSHSGNVCDDTRWWDQQVATFSFLSLQPYPTPSTARGARAKGGREGGLWCWNAYGWWWQMKCDEIHNHKKWPCKCFTENFMSKLCSVSGRVENGGWYLTSTQNIHRYRKVWVRSGQNLEIMFGFGTSSGVFTFEIWLHPTNNKTAGSL